MFLCLFVKCKLVCVPVTHNKLLFLIIIKLTTYFFYIYFILFNYSILHVNLFPQACILPISNHPVILNTSHVRNLLDDYGSLLCCKGREQVVTLCLSGPVLIRRWRSSLHWMVQSIELLDLLHDSLW